MKDKIYLDMTGKYPVVLTGHDTSRAAFSQPRARVMGRSKRFPSYGALIAIIIIRYIKYLSYHRSNFV